METKKILVVIDVQNDFIDGALYNEVAKARIPNIIKKINEFDGEHILITKDTHNDNYMETSEGMNLPVPHCIKDTQGWQIYPQLEVLRKTEAIDKLTFGSKDLVDVLKQEDDLEEITFVGLCTDICVISNVMVVKAFYPETPLVVDAKGCAGVTPQSHLNALEAMKMCQVKVINE